MNYTSVTAVIITIHHLSASLSILLALLLTGLMYKFFIKKGRLMVIITFMISLILGISIADKMLHRMPFGIEIVQAG